MNDSLALRTRQTQALATAQALEASNQIARRYGLCLTPSQIQILIAERFEVLADTGRVEFGEGVLPLLAYAFCDSPYIVRDDYASTLGALQSLFYTFKNETEDAMSDDELVEALKTLYDGKAQGSLEYLENLTPGDLWRALRQDNEFEGGEDADE